MTIMRKTTVRYSDCFKRSSLPSLIKNNKRSLTSRNTYLYFKILSGTWNKEAELTQLKTDLATIDRRILLSITPESGGTEEGKAVEQVTPMAHEQHDTPEKQEVKSEVKFKI